MCRLLGERVAAEWFATTLDVYLLLGDIAEDAGERRTADGRPATAREHAHSRLAHAGADAETFSLEDARALCAGDAKSSTRDASRCVGPGHAGLPEAPPVAIVAGSGEFLALRLLDLLGVRAISSPRKSAAPPRPPPAPHGAG